ncbi:hypothetical protein TB2_014624 [Malus domestica]
MAWVMALVPWALDDTAWACFSGTARVVVVVPWTSLRVATIVAIVVVPGVELRGGGALPLGSHLVSWIAAILFLEY